MNRLEEVELVLALGCAFEKGFVVVEIESRESAELTKKPWPSNSNDSWLSD